MRVEFFEPKLEQGIVHEILQWSKDVLETNSSFFGGLPPCPYAQKAWADHKVSIMFKYEPSFQVLYTCISQFDDQVQYSSLRSLGQTLLPRLNVCVFQKPQKSWPHLGQTNRFVGPIAPHVRQDDAFVAAVEGLVAAAAAEPVAHELLAAS